MKLSVNKAITGALGFSLRHALPFYLLGLMVGLPRYLYSFVPQSRPSAPRPWWEAELAIPAIAAMLSGVVVAIMVHSLKRDRRGEQWSVWPSFFEAAPRLPTVMVVSLVAELAVVLVMAAANSRTGSAFVFAVPLAALGLFLTVVFCVAVPCAAVDNAGVVYCLRRSVELTAGSRLRIAAVYVLSALPLFAVAAAVVVLSDGRISSDSVVPLWSWLLNAAGWIYLAALSVVLHEALVIMKEGAPAETLATAFD